MHKKTSKRNRLALVFALLTVGSMTLFFNLYEPWLPIGPELIEDGSFSSQATNNLWSGWNELTQRVPDAGFGGSPGVVLLTTSSNKNGVLRFTTYNLTNIPAFRVSLRATAHGIVQGKWGYEVPRAVFFYNDAKAKSFFSLHHGVMDISKDTGWRRYKDFFPVPAKAVDARLQIQNLGRAGIMQIDDVSVIPVRPRPSAPWWKLFFGILWTTAFGYCLFVLHPWTRRYGILIVMTLFTIMVGIVLPGKLLDDTILNTQRTAKNLIVKTVATLLHPSVKMPPAKNTAQPTLTDTPKPPKPKEKITPVAEPRTIVDNIHLVGHFTLFSLLAFLSTLSWLSAPPAIRRTAALFAGLVLFAAATEVLQFITDDRAAALRDLLIDSIGMAGAVAAVLLLRITQSLIQRNQIKL